MVYLQSLPVPTTGVAQRATTSREHPLSRIQLIHEPRKRAPTTATLPQCSADASTRQPAGDATSRRSLLALPFAAGLAAVAVPIASCGLLAPVPAAALPLAPLGRPGDRAGGPKRTGLSAEEVAAVLAQNLREGQYFVTGDLTPEVQREQTKILAFCSLPRRGLLGTLPPFTQVFADDCRFRDPTNDVVGLSRYLTALGILFDASASAVRLVDIRVTSPNTIEADWVRAERAEATLAWSADLLH